MISAVDNLQSHKNPDYIRQVLYSTVMEYEQYATDEMCHYIEMLVDEFCSQPTNEDIPGETNTEPE